MVKMKVYSKIGVEYTLTSNEFFNFENALKDFLSAKWYICDGLAINTDEVVCVKEVKEGDSI